MTIDTFQHQGITVQEFVLKSERIVIELEISHPDEWSLKSLSNIYSGPRFSVFTQFSEVDLTIHSIATHGCEKADPQVTSAIGLLTSKHTPFKFDSICVSAPSTELDVVSLSNILLVNLDITYSIDELRHIFSNTTKDLKIKFELPEVDITFTRTLPALEFQTTGIKFDKSKSIYFIESE